ncbi:MAG TPA: adenylyltransferase/cytidyltransferase family protein [Candidatus Paceibacterota bacterium]|nr:adenylyltransferase/cytidyltransferase family protein [Candidatus Paceibacterota bacterium]
MINKKVVIFGVFDGVHEGHLSFINDARKEGNHLVAIVARDSVVEELKGKLPLNTEVERVNALLKVKDIDLVLLGDPKIGTYNILKEIKPDIVFLGYDQEALYKNLHQATKNPNFPQMEIIRGVAYKPEIFHSSILNKNTP